MNKHKISIMQVISLLLVLLTTMEVFVFCFDFDRFSWHGYLLLFNLPPVLINGCFIWIANNKPSQILLLISTICFGAWFSYGTYCIWHSTDAQIALFAYVLGIYSLPIMIPLWMATLLCCDVPKDRNIGDMP